MFYKWTYTTKKSLTTNEPTFQPQLGWIVFFYLTYCSKHFIFVTIDIIQSILAIDQK
jgi:hypothetical protein